MKKLLILVSLTVISSISSSYGLEEVFIRDYLERLENSREYLLLVAEEMPEDKYQFRATEESSSFAENLMHIAWAMDWHSQTLLGGRKARDWETDTELKVHDKSKKEMIAAVNQTFDNSIELIKKFDAKKLDDRINYLGLDRSKRQILLLLSDHITHHRAQMIVSLRLNGLMPPRYISYQ